MEFRILGPLEVWEAGQQIAVGGPKQRRVLAALILGRGRVVPIQRLVDAVWDGKPPSTARKQVQNAVSALRQTAIGTAVIAQGPGYAICAGIEQVDAWQFEECLTLAGASRADRDLAGAAEALQAGLMLWRGPVLAGVGGAVASAAAAQLEERRLAAITEWAEVKLALGRHAEVVDEITAAVEANPLSEPLAGLLMIALYRCGRTADSLVRYHRVRRALIDELGIEPGPELLRLYERILISDPALRHHAAAPARRNDLPRDLPHFAGRTTELGRLTSGADAGRAPAIHAIYGMAGIGKTALAVHAAHRLAVRYLDGQLFVNLHGHTPDRSPLAPEAALDLLLHAVGLPESKIPKGIDEKAALWRAETAKRRLLILLDDALSAAQVRPLLPGSAMCLVLITSRRRFTGLDGVEVLSLDVLNEADAISLFAGIVGIDRVQQERDAVVEVTRLCGGLPLALKAVAMRLRNRPSWPVEHLVERLQDQIGGNALLVAGDDGVATAFAQSCQRMSPEQQRFFHLLGLQAGSDIDAHAAAALAGLSLARAEVLLETLCDMHLLTQQVPGRYRFHDLVRAHVHACACL
ncbi:DNA-binding transcriptional activator of the SARP family [Micromonospora echinaurantiaca]|uniref:DNA-binding transcriptional activator of the SARP family n=1 Tax=Micromonospora echinaurantiaca TaxID=47857 RepID=A0A1C5IFI8_9ACTN|nr:AfsR/SARP family transcriptional regulator [Micromonospora echinaurantiaca]SCG57130.1 DNA-binding transcriptional activator of the SARP family [Micromonospora echinaurantiaca]